VNTARVVDAAIRDMKYARAIAGHAAGENAYAAKEYDKPSNPTYHYILGPRLEARIDCDVPIGTRVFEDDIITYTIRVTNTGEESAIDVLVREALTAYLGYVPGTQTSSRADAQFLIDGNLFGWIVPYLDVNETVVFTFKARVRAMDDIDTRLILVGAQVAECRMKADPQIELMTGNYFRSTPDLEHFQRQGALITVRKVDAATGRRLANAQFVLHQLRAYSKYDKIDDIVLLTDKYGEAYFEEIPLGEYVIYELKAPRGYMGSPVKRSVNIRGEFAKDRTLVVPNYSIALINELAVPNAGMESRNLGDCPQ